ncbi:c-type cytochrome [Phototrophicus methaneseepsis]|uniref:C-type cytochrome n=1 Tax=Phototrophicus methaneseepsis TaxID=2710758 RepID=A0A7S8E809_9CHLR|nr:c-type cytochrome [Phototrophicus methaneseepsis]QPC82083.1 c-type cytochrome [Phototrophicus methaneseepsis]
MRHHVTNTGQANVLNQRKQSIRIHPFAWLLPLMMLFSACSNLAGEQHIVATFTPSAAVSAVLTTDDAPNQSPDLRDGAIIYQQNCTSCHGTGGAGDGELVQDGSVPTMPSFLDVDHMRQQEPADYYDIITHGRIENLMPPWEEALTQQQRWDVAMYVYTLQYSLDQVHLGQDVYSAQCVDCHGIGGEGDGPEMVESGRSAFDMTNILDTAALTDNNIYVSVSEGIGDEMPAFADDLTEEEMWAAVAYARTQSLANFDASRDANLRLAEPGETVTISGTVSQGTQDASLPDSLQVGLRYGSQESGVQSQDVTMGTDGSYTFTEVPVQPDYEYVIFVIYGEQAFLSEVLTGDQLLLENTLNLALYETTDDPAVLTISQLETAIGADRLDVENVTTGLVFNQSITFTNHSDRLFAIAAPTQSGQRSTVSTLIQLPPGAIILNSPDDPRFIIVQQQYALIYTEPLLPGETTVNVAFFLPYESEAVIDQPWQYPIEGEVTVYLAPPNIDLLSDTLQPGEDRVINGVTYRAYSEERDQAANASTIYTLQGELFGRAANADGNVVPSDVLLPVLLVGVALLILIVAVLVIRTQHSPKTDAEIQQLVHQIAELDAQHDQGQINHDLYQRQRADLKARLAALMSQNDDAS